jgi:hypothetical protein
MTYPLRHISIRVPWHDTGWDGRVCAALRLNGACLKLKRIAENRDDAAEESVAGKSLKADSAYRYDSRPPSDVVSDRRPPSPCHSLRL